MLRQAATIWLMHSLAFVAGLILSGVVAAGIWTFVPIEGPNWLLVGSALSVSIIAVGLGYGLYLTLVGLLLNVELCWSFYLFGPVVVLGVMTLVFGAVYMQALNVVHSSLSGYVLLFLIGGIILHRQMRLGVPDEEEQG